MRLIAPIRSNVFRHALVGLAFVTVSACNTAEPTAPNVASPDALAQVAAQLTSFEQEKVLIAFGTPNRTPAQVTRFLSMLAPEFRSINLGPTGVTQTGYQETQAMLASFPTIPYTINSMKAIVTNPNSAVVAYEVTLQTPMGPVRYLASSTWSLRASGEWQTIFYQATPL